MAALETTLTIDLSPETAQLVRQAVKAGDYPDAKTAVEAAVQGWSAQREELPFGLSGEEIDRLIDEGDASGPACEIGIEEITREGFRRAGVPYPEA